MTEVAHLLAVGVDAVVVVVVSALFKKLRTARLATLCGFSFFDCMVVSNEHIQRCPLLDVRDVHGGRCHFCFMLIGNYRILHAPDMQTNRPCAGKWHAGGLFLWLLGGLCLKTAWQASGGLWF